MGKQINIFALEERDSDEVVVNTNTGQSMHPFTFPWKAGKKSGWHLATFLLFSVLVHLSGFYLFQVVYPAPVRVEPKPERITILDSRNPAARTALLGLRDRQVFLEAPSESSKTRMRLRDFSVRFVPLFQDEKISLLPPEEPALRWELLLPNLREKTLSQGDSLDRAEVAPQNFLLSSKLAERGIAPWSILGDYLEGAEVLPNLRVNLWVAEDGSITKAQVDDPTLEQSYRDEINKVVKSTLRFRESEPQSGETQGWVEFQSQ